MKTWADHLLDHLKSCRRCTGAKAAKAPNRCFVAHLLIKLTAKERHGK